MESEFNESAAPATKADIVMVLSELRAFRLEQQAELRAFRVWVEGKFELVEQKFQLVEQKFEAVGQRFDGLQERVGKVESQLEELGRLLGWRLTVLNVTLVAAIIGAGAWS